MVSERFKPNKDINSKNESPLSEEISFKEIVLNIIVWYKYLLSNWVNILLVVLLGGIAGYIHANRQSLLYIATNTFTLQEAGSGVQPDALTSFLGINALQGGGIFQGDNLLELYRTRFMLKKTLLSTIPGTKNEHVIDRYMALNGLRQAWKDSARLRNINFFVNYKDKKQARIQDSLMTTFTNDLKFNYIAVDKDRRLNLLIISVRSRDEDFSKLLNDQIVKIVNDYYIQTKTQKSLENLKLLQHQTDSIRAALNGAMYKVASSTDVNINVNPARQVLRVPSQRNQVDAETNRAMLNELVRNVELAKMSLRKETPLIQIFEEATFPLERVRPSRAVGILMGVLLAGVFAVTYYTIIYIFKKIME